MLVVAALICSACGGGTPGFTPSGTSGPSATPSASPAPTCAERVLAGMTEAERVGQLFVVGLADDELSASDAAAIRSHHFGSVSFVVTTSVGVHGVRAVADAVQSLATQAATAGVGFFVAANQEGGEIQALRGPGFSTIASALAQGQLDPAVLQGDAVRWARELLAAGVNLNFAPVMDVVPPGTDSTNQPIGVLHRAFGHDPSTVGSHGVAFIRGMAQVGVATTAKHFPGLGRVQGNTDFTAGVIDRSTGPADPYLQSFQQAIAAGVPFVMVALATYTKIDPDHLAVFSPVVMQLLRDQLRFTGVIVSDDIGAAQAVAGMPATQRALDFIQAGGDLIVSKTIGPAVSMASGLLARANADASFRARVDESALRVLTAKAAVGLAPCA